MAKTCHPDYLDLALNGLKSGSGSTGPANKYSICSAQPTTYTDATITYALGLVTISSSDYTGPANGSSGGTQPRKLTVNARSGDTVASSGTVTYAALSDSANSKLLIVTTVTSQAVTSGNLYNTGSFAIEIGAPT